jgi:hypothetical protein
MFVWSPVHSCTHWLRPRNSPSPPAFGLIYEGAYWSAKIDVTSLCNPLTPPLHHLPANIGKASPAGQREDRPRERAYCNPDGHLPMAVEGGGGWSHISKTQSIHNYELVEYPT